MQRFTIKLIKWGDSLQTKMKKTIIILATLFVFTGIAHASVESDTTALRYQKCIQELAKLDSVNYSKPIPNDPAFAPGNPGNKTYDSVMQSYNAQIAYREKKRAECNSLSGSVATKQSVTKTVTPTATISGAVVDDTVVDQPTEPLFTEVDKILLVSMIGAIFGINLIMLILLAVMVKRM